MHPIDNWEYLHNTAYLSLASALCGRFNEALQLARENIASIDWRSLEADVQDIMRNNLYLDRTELIELVTAFLNHEQEVVEPLRIGAYQWYLEYNPLSLLPQDHGGSRRYFCQSVVSETQVFMLASEWEEGAAVRTISLATDA